MLRSAKNIVKGYSSTEVLVRDATANNSTEPSIDILDDLAEKSYNSNDFFEIMDMIDKRINDKGKYWRHVAKSLTLLDYLVRFGSENCVLWCKENIYIVKTLREFTHEDEAGFDEGQVIRVKAKELTSLLMDDERLKQERSLNKRNRNKRRGRGSRDRNTSREDDDLRRALEESKITAEEDEMRRRRAADMEADRQAALQLSKEEEELKRLQELQRQQQQQQLLLQQQQQQQQAQQTQPMYYDVFGNPITPEEYLQYQQQQALLAQQQQAALALQEQQYWALQQQQEQHAALLAQQQQQYGIQQQSLETGSNNPFSLNNQSKANTSNTVTTAAAPTAPTSTAATTNQPLKQTRTGNQSISDKYSSLNSLLASGTGIDTFGNTGDQRIPAQHTKTGTFINSQGTGYRQMSDADNKPNPFLTNQYTGLPSSNIVPSQTGYGFGNQINNNANNNNNMNSHTLLDL